MKVLNIGSMNLDHVYNVDHIILPGETQATTGLNLFLGGKGMNQSIALAKAGVEVYHGGMIGKDGYAFIDACKEYGVHYDYIREAEGNTGHTIIQIDKNAQNSILLFAGTNDMLTESYVDEVIADFEEGDILLLQNEVNRLPYMVDKAYEKGMQIALNPSPFNEKLNDVDMSKISYFLMNEVEGEQITGFSEPEKIIDRVVELYPEAKIVLTLGNDGAIYADKNVRYHQSIFKVQAVDTTAAGDTFTGYFLAGIIEGMEIPEILKMSAKASSIAVTRQGAVPSIPYREEVLASLKEE